MSETGYRIKRIRWNGNCNPSAETLISIRARYDVDLNWLLAGVDSVDGITYEDHPEKELVETYRKLNGYDINEIIEIVTS